MKRERELIVWLDAVKELPDAESEVLVQYQRSDCDELDTTLAIYDDSHAEGPWFFVGVCFGKVLFWSEKPSGPEVKKVDHE